MTTRTSPSARPVPRAPQAVVARPAWRPQRARDFGVGYGRSSGYASGKRYVDDWGNARFRCG